MNVEEVGSKRRHYNFNLVNILMNSLVIALTMYNHVGIFLEILKQTSEFRENHKEMFIFFNV